MVALGEARMLRAQRERSGSRVGMNLPGYDNRQLALNILHWLSRDLQGSPGGISSTRSARLRAMMLHPGDEVSP